MGIKETFMRIAERKAWEDFDVLMLSQDEISNTPVCGIAIQGKLAGFSCNNSDICFCRRKDHIPVKIAIKYCLKPGKMCNHLVFKFIQPE